MRLIILPGDGIGPEITDATLRVLEAASARFGLGLELRRMEAGRAALEREGTTIPPAVEQAVREADGLILGPMDTYAYAGQGANPSAFFRKAFDLYANIRPARTWPGLRSPTGAEFDLVVVRENTEGFYADRNMEAGNAELLVTPEVVVSLRRITRACCDRIAAAAFRLAARRRRRVTAVHKANVLARGDGMFLESCRREAAAHPGIAYDEVIVDAMAAHLVRHPGRFDVVVTTNMFGDILSDLAIELSGSLGLGGSVNAGERFCMAQAAHGSAPDIAGQGVANPASLILSAGMLLGWLAERRGGGHAFAAAADAIETAVAGAVAAGETTRDLGGRLGTAAMGEAVAGRVAVEA
ncbi:isocitrate/isopropylmalate dehydrogenase family protein [Crenalkalicoccus roseus]|uniref:isocitrate/isopropylmalate dehydrogenase family protein n=1 Tax=Crenalkalicoccus roseus TaxID=1485588 RepID=UPI00108184B0|nr:isocitrate/isopropylmalate family dehydrogenase [Crenalkalicoccus roseus]